MQVAEAAVPLQRLKRLAHPGEFAGVHLLTLLLAPGQQTVVTEWPLRVATAEVGLRLVESGVRLGCQVSGSRFGLV